MSNFIYELLWRTIVVLVIELVLLYFLIISHGISYLVDKSQIEE